ncbi:FAD dependent oxidoreductase [Kalaharituber pfeilii]|nr:FAD dependent oxidoreductase [Kalaharituber pfeilii]
MVYGYSAASSERKYASIVIIGSGVFGLTTALSLSLNNSSLPPHLRRKITLIDRSTFPSPDSSSIDSSRIVRADYKDPDYAALCISAQAQWRSGTGVWAGLGDERRYSQSGLVLVSNAEAKEGEDGGRDYVRKSMENVKRLLCQYGEASEDNLAYVIQELASREEIEKVCAATGGATGEVGYVNWLSGWVDAQAAMKFVRARCQEQGDIDFLTGEVIQFVERADDGPVGEGKVVEGVRLRGGEEVRGDLIVLATGAWTPGLIDLTGRATSTGQVLGYVRITNEEEERYKDIPVILNLSNGLFIIPPKDGILKIARHAVGYINTQSITFATHDNDANNARQVSIPRTHLTTPASTRIPSEGESALRLGLREMVPALGDRPFERTRICWYTDTPTGDFIVDHVPGRRGLFVATGGSGHAFKFLPVLGDVIVGIICGDEKAAGRWREKWRWRTLPGKKPKDVITKDGSRAGMAQMELDSLFGHQGPNNQEALEAKL